MVCKSIRFQCILRRVCMEEIVLERSLVTIQGWPVLRIGHKWGAQWRMMTEAGFVQTKCVRRGFEPASPMNYIIQQTYLPHDGCRNPDLKSCPHQEWAAVPSLKVFHWNSSGRHHKLTWYTLPSCKCLAVIPNCRLLTQKLTLKF